jgi:hypothetical protein
VSASLIDADASNNSENGRESVNKEISKSHDRLQQGIKALELSRRTTSQQPIRLLRQS